MSQAITSSDIFCFISSVMAVHDGGGCKFEIHYDDATFTYHICERAYGKDKQATTLGYGRSIGEAFEDAMSNRKASS